MSKEAMKLALEYLKLQKKYGPAMAYGNTTIDEAIDAIKKVLVADFVSDFVEQPAQRKPLTDEQQVAESLRVHGLALVKTASGYEVLKLDQIAAHNIKENT